MRKFYALLALVATIIGSALAFGDGLTVPFSMPATACTNQFVRSIAAITGAGTCASIAAGDFPALTGDVTTPGGSLATTLAASARLTSKIISITRDLTVATGSVAYTGMGFVPTTCFQTGGVAGSLVQFVSILGMSDSARTVVSTNLASSVISTGQAFFIVLFDATSANGQTATIVSYDADGLTLAWVKTGTPTGTATIKIMCYR